MKLTKFILSVLLLSLFLTGLCACGSSEESNSNGDGQQTGFEGQQTNIDEQQTNFQEATPEPVATKPPLPTANPESSAESLLGKWEDISTPENFVTITKEDSKYKYKDSDGEYYGTFEKDALILEVTPGDSSDTAKVYIDGKGHLLMVYQGNVSEFEKSK
jgi:hypothetical protein